MKGIVMSKKKERAEGNKDPETRPMMYTPGPWIVCEGDSESQTVFIEQDRACLIDEEPSTIGEIDLSGEGIDEITGLANARLIAAAPELLQSLRDVLRYCVTPSGMSDKGKGRTPEQDAAYTAARAAIAKAEGGAE